MMASDILKSFLQQQQKNGNILTRWDFLIFSTRFLEITDWCILTWQWNRPSPPAQVWINNHYKIGYSRFAFSIRHQGPNNLLQCWDEGLVLSRQVPRLTWMWVGETDHVLSCCKTCRLPGPPQFNSSWLQFASKLMRFCCLWMWITMPRSNS